MCRILSNDELRQRLHLIYSKAVNSEGKSRRIFNIDNFLSINREGLEYQSQEKRLWLYSTLNNESIGIQYPGKESVEAEQPKPNDFRPIIKLADGTIVPDTLTFGDIWDIFDTIAREHRGYLSFVATLVYSMGYLQQYTCTQANYNCELVSISPDDNVEITELAAESLSWYSLVYENDVWTTLNNDIGSIRLESGQVISFEAFIKYLDLLMQNEDCKYYYIKHEIEDNADYRNTLDNGRNNTSNSNLLILNYLQNRVTLSSLVNSFQKARGVAYFRKADYCLVTDNIVTMIEHIRCNNQ